jgi:hypothetical protein
MLEINSKFGHDIEKFHPCTFEKGGMNTEI